MEPSLTNAQFPVKMQALFEPSRFKVLYGGRGAGRSWGCARALLIIGAQRPIRVLCARELQNSIADSVHKLLSDQITALGLQDHYELQQKYIFGKNGTQFAFEGIKNNVTRIKSFEGIDYCWVEEADKVTKSSWEILIPTIRKPDSEIWITFNPTLEKDYTYRRFVTDATSDCKVIFMTWRDNPFFPEVLKKQMLSDKERDYDSYLHVWEGQCIQILEGAVFAKELRRVRSEGRITQVPYERSVPVMTFWDLGKHDQTAVWFIQQVAMQTRVLEYFEASMEDLPYYFKELQQKAYFYDCCYLPHDAYHKRLGMKLTIEGQFRAANFLTARTPKLSVPEKINFGRILLNSCWFDTQKTEEGLQRLTHYRYKIIQNDETGEKYFSQDPIHDENSNGADAFMYAGVNLKRLARKQQKQRENFATRLEQRLLVKQRQRESEFSGRPTSAQGWMS
jgi:phage terminase large subunit